jgi:DNA-binding NarL/FixJ family response regulator
MNVLIIDDHALIREGIALMVKEILGDAVVWQANSFNAGMEIASRVSIDFTFLDLQLPDESGYVALERIKRVHELMPVVVVSALEDRESILRALEMGATAYVPKSANSERMRRVVQDVFEGRICLPEIVLGNARTNLRDLREVASWNLTERQKEVLALLILGLSNKLIARRLNIVESTVKIHVSAILRELKVSSRTQALIAVARQGIRLPMR